MTLLVLTYWLPPVTLFLGGTQTFKCLIATTYLEQGKKLRKLYKKDEVGHGVNLRLKILTFDLSSAPITHVVLHLYTQRDERKINLCKQATQKASIFV